MTTLILITDIGHPVGIPMDVNIHQQINEGRFSDGKGIFVNWKQQVENFFSAWTLESSRHGDKIHFRERSASETALHHEKGPFATKEGEGSFLPEDANLDSFERLEKSLRGGAEVVILSHDATAIATLEIMRNFRLVSDNDHKWALDGKGELRLMSILSGADASIADVVLTGGSADAGGAIAVATGGRLVLTRCEIVDNIASSMGGAIFAWDAILVLTRCVFARNRAIDGGALYLTESSAATSEQCDFDENVAQNEGGAVLVSRNSQFKQKGGTFRGNAARFSGGALAALSGSSVVASSGVDFCRNRAGGTGQDQRELWAFDEGRVAAHGGAIMATESAIELANVSLAANSASNDGGGVACFLSRLTTSNATIVGGSATIGGGLSLKQSNWKDIGESTVADNIGSGVWLASDSATLTSSSTRVLRNKPDDVQSTASSVADGLENEAFMFDSMIQLPPDALEEDYDRRRVLVEKGEEQLPDTAAPTTETPVPTYATESPTATEPIGNACIGDFVALLTEVSNALDATLMVCGSLSVTETLEIRSGTRVTLIGTQPEQEPCILDGGGRVQIARVHDACLTLSGLELRGGMSTSESGGALVVLEGGRLEARGCNFVGNRAQAAAGGVVWASGGAVVLERCRIASNSAMAGGAVALEERATLSLLRVDLLDNEAAGDGGALLATRRSRVALEECRFEGNTAGAHGGAIILDDSSLAANKCHIRSNSASQRGGSLAVRHGASVVLFSSGVTSNLAMNGSAVAALEGSSLYTVGAEIEENNGFGAIALWSSATWTAAAETVLAANWGGGALVSSAGSIYASSLRLRANHPFDCLARADAGAIIGTILTPDEEPAVLTGVGRIEFTTEPYSSFSMPGHSKLLGTLQGSEGIAPSPSPTQPGSPQLLSAISAAARVVNLDDLLTICSGVSGDYAATLIADISLTASLDVRSMAIALRSDDETRTIDGSGKTGLFTVSDGGSLELSRLRLARGSRHDGGAIIVLDGSTLRIFGCKIIDCTAVADGGAIFVSGHSRLDMKTTEVRGARSYERGGALFASTQAYVSIVASTIVDSVAAQEGGACYVEHSASLDLTNCTIRANSAQHGGALVVTQGASVAGARTIFASNAASGPASSGDWRSAVPPSAGAVLLAEAASARFARCHFLDNVADTGGAVFARDPGTMLITASSTFNANTARLGSAVYLDLAASWASLPSTVVDHRQRQHIALHVAFVALGRDVQLLATKLTFQTSDDLAHIWALDNSAECSVLTDSALRIVGPGADHLRHHGLTHA